MSAIQQLMAAYGAAAPLGVSQVFSSTAYTGNGSTQAINNGVNLSGAGGLLWLKGRSGADRWNFVFDSTRGLQFIATNVTNASGPGINWGGFGSSGFTLGFENSTNAAGELFISWAFSKAPKFFDVVTYTGDGAGERAIPHGLGVRPRLIVGKRTDASENWAVLALTDDSDIGTTPAWRCLSMNTTGGGNQRTGSVSSITSSAFDPNWLQGDAYKPMNLNVAGAQYVAYLFAHDTGADGLIRCGGYTGNGSATGPPVTLGWEPQFLMIKNASGTGDWVMYDSARDATNSRTATLLANSSAAESVVGPDIDFTSAGFQIKSSAANVNTSGSTYIYMAIRKP